MAMQKKKENSQVKHGAFFYILLLYLAWSRMEMYTTTTLVIPKKNTQSSSHAFYNFHSNLLKPPKFMPSIQSTVESSVSFPITLSAEFFKAVPQFYFIFLTTKL